MNKYRKQQSLNYSINDLVLQGENALKSDPLIEYILPRAQSLEDERNPNRNAQYRRYVNQATYYNYPLAALINALGLANKGKADVKLPNSMAPLIDEATIQGTPLAKIQDDLIKSIFFFGSAIIHVVIPNDMELSNPPKLEVISAKKIIDFHTKTIGDHEEFDWILLDATKEMFDPKTKNYQTVRLYRLLALDINGYYYEAVFPQLNWYTFDILHPELNETNIDLTYPQFFDNISFIPAVGVNNRSVEFRFYPAYIQDLIDLSLSIFSLDADLRMSLYMQANPFLAIYGSNLESKEICQGMYAVNIFEDTGAKAEFVSPSCGGMQMQFEKLIDLKKDAERKVYDIINLAGSASGDALAIRINSSTTSLINVIQTIGLSIKKALQIVALVMQESPDQIDYIPYVGFSNIQTGENAKDKQFEEKNDKKIEKEEKDEENLDKDKKIE